MLLIPAAYFVEPMPNIPGKLILASRSPRRRELLEAAGYELEVIPPSESAECGICSRETPQEMVARLACQKAQDVAHKMEQGLILGCDTVVQCSGHILGKPNDLPHARQMLELLRGRQHHVYTGVCLWQRPGDRSLVKTATTMLRMDNLSDQQIGHYLDSGAWQDKAGGFGLQDRQSWIHILQGSESNVVGLPMQLLAEMLREFRASSAANHSA